MKVPEGDIQEYQTSLKIKILKKNLSQESLQILRKNLSICLTLQALML